MFGFYELQLLPLGKRASRGPRGGSKRGTLSGVFTDGGDQRCVDGAPRRWPAPCCTSRQHAMS